MAEPLNFDSRLGAIEREMRNSRLASRNGGGEPPSGIEPRIARLETSVAHIERDAAEIRVDLKDLRIETRAEFKGLRKTDESNFRLLFGALIAVALGLAGIMAKGFHWL